ncbi:MAG: AraC family transcriptional regulator [Ruminococcaceae bacterium]|nr:AraC family transcriptional regulator [Oscillospiraceae bacterium]
MKIIPFKEMYYTDFRVCEAMSKPQNWYERGNVYCSLGKPKPSHTLLWFKNCRGRITSKTGEILHVERNQLTYMTKGIEYTVDFYDTAPNQADSIVFHFQLTDAAGEEITPSVLPVLCIRNVDVSMAMAMEMAADEFRKNVVCVPEVTAVIYRIFAQICKKQRDADVKNKYAYIRTGIDLLENNSDMSIEEIARQCGVSEGYFRRLFREYSGENPIDFRQKRRIEKARQMLLMDTFTIGEIAQELHFTDIYHFSKTFKKYCGVSPSRYLQSEK